MRNTTWVVILTTSFPISTTTIFQKYTSIREESKLQLAVTYEEGIYAKCVKTLKHVRFGFVV